MLKPCAQLLLFLLVIPLTATLTRADPIVITSGSFSVARPNRSPVYTFTGVNFSVTASKGDGIFTGPEQSCFPCVGGDIIKVTSTFIAESLGKGTVTLNGMTFDNVTMSGPITFTGPNLIMPTSDAAFLTLTAPFTLSGSLSGCIDNHVFCQPVFTVDVTGSGIATIQLFSYLTPLGDRLFEFQSVTYTIENTAVPEPASILMLLSGITAFGGAKLLRRAGARRLKKTDSAASHPDRDF